MANIPDFVARFTKINIKATVQECFRLEGFDIMESIRHQMLRGERGNGGKILPTLRNREYAQRKNQKNPLAGFGTPDLYDTGAFQGGMYIKFGNMTFTIGSNDTKAPDLETKYTKDIFAPNDTSKREFTPKIYERLMRSLRNQAGLS